MNDVVPTTPQYEQIYYCKRCGSNRMYQCFKVLVCMNCGNAYSLAVNELWDKEKSTPERGGYYGAMDIEKIELMPKIDNIDLLFKV